MSTVDAWQRLAQISDPGDRVTAWTHEYEAGFPSVFDVYDSAWGDTARRPDAALAAPECVGRIRAAESGEEPGGDRSCRVCRLRRRQAGDELRALDAAGRLRVRVNAYLPVNFADEKFGHWFLEFEPRYAYSPQLRLAGIKLFLDHDWGTDFHWDQGELDEYVLTAHRNGWQVAAHTVSAAAHDQILTAVARAQAAHPDPDARHRVEHVIQLRDDQLTRMRELGMIASIQPAIPGDLAAETGFPELVASAQTRWIARWRDLVDTGVRTIGSTDMPWLVLELVGRPTEPPHGSPLEAVHQAMTRQSYSGRAPEGWQLAQRLTVGQALRLFTVDAVYGTFEENVKGSLISASRGPRDPLGRLDGRRCGLDAGHPDPRDRGRRTG